ncbi:hypothetical protein GALMADRAFT_240466 [Galerina marginata CBS 339.88]|uniref:Uncharacterized protein n=1 Tax=Galerina marginata (strain CBS 339.88) TaxID=685588 RepID=A0A067TQ55_GALM3|nr:hypothetical protein GALMADRAFT_240466 [Galerina marginata CBS 339.88]
MPNNRQDPSTDAELSKLTQQKLRCKAERKALVLRIEELDQEVIRIDANYAAIHNKRLPLLGLPTEVTCMILQFAVGSGYHISGQKRRYFEVIASHVCRQWRSIALTYSRLWARFCYVGPKTFLNDMDRLDAYLNRSVSHELELWLDFRMTPIQNELDLLEMALGQIERWKCFVVSSGGEDSLFGIHSRIGHLGAPKLEHFSFVCEVFSPSGPHIPISNLEPTLFTNGAPKLQSVVLGRSSAICLPSLSNITTLCLETLHEGMAIAFPWSTFHLILTLPLLSNLSLAGDVVAHPHASATSPITMGNLLHFRCGGCGVLPFFLPLLRAPLLQTLIIQNDGFNDLFLESVGASAEPYAFPALQTISLLNITFDTLAAAWYFARMTESATEILLSEEESWQTLLSALQCSEEYPEKTYWSKVKLLTCDFCHWNINDYTTFLEFAKARSKNGLIIRIFDRLDCCWRQDLAREYDVLKEICTVEVMDVTNNPFSQPWPPGAYNYLHDSEDFFRVDPY